MAAKSTAKSAGSTADSMVSKQQLSRQAATVVNSAYYHSLPASQQDAFVNAVGKAKSAADLPQSAKVIMQKALKGAK